MLTSIQPPCLSSPPGPKAADPINDKLTVNSVSADPTVYEIGGSNYFKLRDLGKALDFYVGYSGGQVIIDTGRGDSK